MCMSWPWMTWSETSQRPAISMATLGRWVASRPAQQAGHCFDGGLEELHGTEVGYSIPPLN